MQFSATYSAEIVDAFMVGLAYCLKYESVPPTNPNTIERTLPNPTEPSPTPPISPSPPPVLPSPPTQNPPNVTFPEGDRLLVKTIEVTGSTVLQWVQQLSSKTLLLARLSAQLTGDSLLSLEKFSVGGLDTVRGYRQNQLVTDNGIASSFELRFPPISNYSAFQLAPFFDIGTAWNNRESDPRTNTLASLGLGLIWQPSRELNLRLDYGIPLVDVNSRGNTLQDEGLYFSLRYQPF